MGSEKVSLSEVGPRGAPGSFPNGGVAVLRAESMWGGGLFQCRGGPWKEGLTRFGLPEAQPHCQVLAEGP